MKKKQYNYLKVKEALIESGQLDKDRKILEIKSEDLDEALIEKEEGFYYEIDSEVAGIVHKKNYYWNRTELQRIAGIFPKTTEYNYKLSKKQLGIKDD